MLNLNSIRQSSYNEEEENTFNLSPTLKPLERLRVASKEELSEMIQNNKSIENNKLFRFNDPGDMELSHTTHNFSISPFIGVIDECINELQRSQSKKNNNIFKKINFNRKTHNSEEESFKLAVDNNKKEIEDIDNKNYFYEEDRVILEENRQLRVLMSEYLKEIDQLRYAYTKLRKKYTKSKSKISELELEVKKTNEMNKLLKETSNKHKNVFQSFCLCSNYQNFNKKFEDFRSKREHKFNSQKPVKLLNRKKSWSNFEKSKKPRKIKSQESLERLKNYKKVGIINNYSPLIKERSERWEKEDFNKKLELVKEFRQRRKKIGGSLGNYRFTYEDYEQERGPSILKNYEQVKKLKKKILKEKNDKLKKRLLQGDNRIESNRMEII